MKRLIKKIFKIEPQLNYIITEYQPVEINPFKTDVKIKERNFIKTINIDKKKMNKIQ
jgi:hypothetical protein